MISGRGLYPAVLLALGLGWGLTQPLGKIAASTGHQPFGLIFWQLAICVVVLGVISAVLRQRPRFTRRALEFYLIVAVSGTLIPNYTFYLSVARLPSGIMSVIVAAIPMLTFPLALLFKMDRFHPLRFLGLCLGMAGVALIALPGAALPEAAMVAFLPVALIGPFFYALESLYVARNGMAGMQPVPAMLGASVVGVVLCLPMALWQGQFFAMPLPPGRVEWALIAASSIHAVIYAAYIWLAARAGAVFAGQTSYIITFSGVIWAMVLLGERPAPAVWLAAALMLGGMFLVRPRPKQP